ncbi:hypothetical protein [Yoonia sp.]|uniref:hypothetical protein n=1 Tax=Yoonia sp. TaxID=2212373 RepID=UPI0039199714
MTWAATDTMGPQDDLREISLQGRIIWLITLVICSGIGWAFFATLDEVTTADGVVIPIRNEQVIQSLDGGLVRELAVRADQVVEANEVLARLDPTRLSASVDETSAKLSARRARIARLTAEVADLPLVFPPDLLEKTELILTETALYEARRQSFLSSIALIDDPAPCFRKNLPP